MSIIYDALKKVQQAINQKDKQISPQKTKLYLLYVLVICVGLFLGNIIFGFLTAHLKKPLGIHPKEIPLVKKSEVNLSPILSKETPSQAIPIVSGKMKSEPPKSFVLNGVFFAEDQGYALINNRIAGVGDVVDGATVKKIGLDEVELEVEGKTIKLSTYLR